MLDSFTRRRSRLGIVCTIGALALTTAACGGDDDTDSATSAAGAAAESVVSDATASDTAATDTAAAEGGTASGKVAIDGSSTVLPISNAVAEEFQKENQGVEVTVGSSGTGGGFEKFCRGETDISNASRPIKEEETAACTEAGIEFAELEVALDGLSVVVNPQNDWATCLTVDQMKKVWNEGSTVKSWKEIDPSFPDEPLKLYGPGTDSGTFDYFTDEINGEEGVSRADYTASEDDNVLVQGVGGDKGAMGYFGFSYYEENKDTIKALEIDGGDGCVAPTAETVKDGTYKPLSRPLYIYVAKKAAARPEVKSFVDYYIAQAPELVESVGYVPLDDYSKAEAAVAGLAG